MSGSRVVDPKCCGKQGISAEKGLKTLKKRRKKVKKEAFGGRSEPKRPPPALVFWPPSISFTSSSKVSSLARLEALGAAWQMISKSLKSRAFKAFSPAISIHFQPTSKPIAFHVTIVGGSPRSSARLYIYIYGYTESFCKLFSMENGSKKSLNSLNRW